MAKKFKMVISPDGTILTSVYNDVFDISQIGTPKINRATEVRYNNKKGRWEIEALPPIFPESFILTKTFKTRAIALEYEIKFLNLNMERILADIRSGASRTGAQS